LCSEAAADDRHEPLPSGEKIAASGLAAIDTTVGRPRFKLGYELAGTAAALAPAASCTSRTAPSSSPPTAAASSAPAPRCHGRVFAEWWQEQTGEEVVEL
jgi:hypothetical protein